MSFKSHNHKGNSRRRERHEDQEQLSGATFKGHKRHGVTKSRRETDGYYDFESTTLDTISEDEDSAHSRKFREVFAETEEYPQSVVEQVERARIQNSVQLRGTARVEKYHQDIARNFEPPLNYRPLSSGTRSARTNPLHADWSSPRQGRVQKRAPQVRAKSLMQAKMVHFLTMELNKLKSQLRGDSGVEDEWESISMGSTIPEPFALPTSMPGTASLTHSRQAGSATTQSEPTDVNSCDVMWVPTTSKDFPQVASLAEVLLLRRSPSPSQRHKAGTTERPNFKGECWRWHRCPGTRICVL